MVDAEAIQRFAQVAFDGLAGFVDVRLLAEKGMPEQPPQCYSLPVNDGLAPALVAVRHRGAHDRPRLLRCPGLDVEAGAGASANPSPGRR